MASLRPAVLTCALALLASPSGMGQDPPASIVDVHLHALHADDQGPPPVAYCISNPGGFPTWDGRRPYADEFMAFAKKPPCADAVWSPTTDDALMTDTLAILRRRNIIGVTSGPQDVVEKWRAAAPDRIIPGLSFSAGSITPDELRALVAQKRLAVFGEIVNQYQGIEPDDPAFEPYLALAEELDVPVALHVGTGPPGTPYMFAPKYRARMHSPLKLEEPLLRHPKLRLYLMHAGWPMIDDVLALLWTHPQVYVDTGVIVTALPRPEFYRYLQRIVEAGFGRRVMFGSDQMVWPAAIEKGIAVIEEAPFLSPAQKRDILYNNAARFLRLNGAK